jgi:hypothetical protein
LGVPLSGADADVWVSATPSISIGGTPETATNTDAGAWITYKAATHPWWDPAQPIVVQNSPNGTTGWVTVTDYTFQYVGGIITFNTARVAATNNFVRIQAGYYFTATQCDESKDWSLSLKGAVEDTTIFQNGGWRRKTAVVKEASGKIGTFRTDDRLSKEMGNLLVFQLFVAKAGNDRWEFYGYVTGVDPKQVAVGVATQDISFDVSGGVYFLTV